MIQCSRLSRYGGCSVLMLITCHLLSTFVVNAQSPTNCVTAASGVVGWWSAEENAEDQTQANPGTLQGGVTFETGEVGKAFGMHGGVDGVKITGSAPLDVGAGNGFTIEVWINPESLQVRSPLVEWNREGTTSTEWGPHLWILKPGDFGPDAVLFANVQDTGGGGHYLSSSGNILVTNAWQHVAVTYDKTSGVGRLYLNGQIVADSNLGIVRPETRYNLFLGKRPAGDSAMSYTGLLDEVAIYDHPLTQAELQAIYNAGSAGKCPLNSGGNRFPSISAIANQTLVEGESTGPIPFTVSDAETAPEALVVTRSSSNPAVIADANIELSGSGSNRFVNVTSVSNHTGSASITLTVSDGEASRSTSFSVLVRPPQGSPAIEPLPDQTVLIDQPTEAMELHLSDADTPVDALRLSGVSSNPEIVPDANIFFGMALGKWYATVTPVFGRTGSSRIRVTVSDGTSQAATEFQMVVNAPPPTTGRFVNSSGMNIPASGVADAYPSAVDGSGMNGPITKLVLSIDKFSHTNVHDVNMLLVSPAGQKVLALSHVSGNRVVANVRISLRDDATYFLPQDFALWSEPLKPTGFAPAPSFPAPAPAGPYGATFSTFNGADANGTWSLYVFDDL